MLVRENLLIKRKTRERSHGNRGVKIKNCTMIHLMEGFVEELRNGIVGSSSGWVSMGMK